MWNISQENNVALEINSFPERLDLNDTNIMKAQKYKVKFSIDTDAHNVAHLKFMRYGIGTARRGWLTKEKVTSGSKEITFPYFKNGEIRIPLMSATSTILSKINLYIDEQRDE